MPTYNEQLQKVYHLYEAEHENDPVGTRDVVDWAIKNELMKAPDVDPLAKLAGDMADALRAEYRVDSKGRRESSWRKPSRSGDGRWWEIAYSSGRTLMSTTTTTTTMNRSRWS